MKKLYIAIISATLLLSSSVLASTQQQPANRTITVNQNAALTVPAENATIHAQLKVVSESVENSYAQVMEKLVKLTKKMQQFGLDKSDITVSAITQGAEYRWTANTKKLAGYSATCSLRIQMDSIEDSYKIHNEFAAFPELAILRTEYGLNEYTKVKAQTLETALEDAREKAIVMAKALDAQIGQVLTIQELGYQPAPVARVEAMAQNISGAVPNPINITTPGSVTVTSSVSAVFELK